MTTSVTRSCFTTPDLQDQDPAMGVGHNKQAKAQLYFKFYFKMN